MPLLDQCHPPFTEHRHFESFHSAWANAIVRQLNGAVLPQGYFAEPSVRLASGRAEADVAAFDIGVHGRAAAADGLEPTWAPPDPAVTAVLDFADADLFEVRICHEDGGPTLVAAIELVSPANKDRPESRRAFAIQCGSYLQSRMSLVVVDVVTSRRANLLADLWDLSAAEMSVPASLAADALGPLYAASCRALPQGDRVRLECWPGSLEVGRPLPTLPLWLPPELAVKLDLEASFVDASRALRLES